MLRNQLAARVLTVLSVVFWLHCRASLSDQLHRHIKHGFLGRTEASSTPLGNGKVLVAGGLNGLIVSGTELYDPVSNSWSSAGNLTMQRYQHTATMLASGEVLVVEVSAAPAW